MTIIQRRELDRVLGVRWLLLYGRRKTGKTFYVRERSQYSKYFVVTRGRSLVDIESGEELTISEFTRLLPYMIQSGRVVIDEFHRLDEPFFSLLQGLSGKGELTLITSTRHYFRRFIGENSPLLGLFHLQEVRLVDPRDAMAYVAGLGIKGKSLMELACLVQEPWLAQTVETMKERTFEVLGNLLRDYVPSLTGEIFTEEDKELSQRYFAILEAVADGKRTSGEIASELFSRGLIEKNHPGAVSQYLETLVNMGLLERILLYGKRRKGYHYRHVSPVADFAFYLNSKYGFFETGLPEKNVSQHLGEKMPRYMETFFERFLARVYGLQPVKIALPELEVDIALRKHKRLALVGEVKWKTRLTKKELRSIEDKLSSLGAERQFLIVPDRSAIPEEPEEVEVLDWKNFVELSKM
ncbi:ATP-binding protein [Thermococcus indicus]|uniref:ATP-binding protein n=2 Tax=Thermococcus indicus TaxID=2586643 RepID=A0A4Y5SN62_9EURY|nr:ATP-binding protein [Thermococcus indicus]